VRSPVLTVHYIAPPVVSSPSVSGKQIQFSFIADSNRNYTVETRNSLTQGDWASLTNVPAQPTTTIVHVSDFSTNEAAFYRVRSP
jgi:hypothetical protein